MEYPLTERCADEPESRTLDEDTRLLIDRCLSGEQAAMLELVQRYGGSVFGLCYRMLGHRQDAEDAAQETFTRVLGKLHQFDVQRDFEPWLLAIAGNRCRTALSSRQRRLRFEPVIGDVHDGRPDENAARDLAEEVRLALIGVRPEYRQAFLLFHDRGLSYADIAEAMDCPIGTVKTWVHRARRDLIDQLGRRGVIEEPRDAVRRV